MTEIVSMAGILGLMYLGKYMNQKEEYSLLEEQEPEEPEEPVSEPRPEGNLFNDIAPDRYPGGGLPYYLNETSEPYTSGIMNNTSPVEKSLVGPGLGVGPDVPAYGGFQQLFRVKPNNVGAYKLTTLPGRSGPASDVTGGRSTAVGQLNHKIPAKTAYLPSRRPQVMGRAQGQGGAVTGMTNYGKFEKTVRPTNRSETTVRNDALSYGGASKFVAQPTLAQNPTRNKGDFNAFETNHYNNPSPGINNFIGGYTNTPSVRVMSNSQKILSAQQLQEYGLRPAENRSNPDRAGNSGRMNVRGNPINQNGAVTAVRADTSRIDGRKGPVDGERSQQYVKPVYQDLNTYKGMQNPRATSQYLNTAQHQLANNEFVPKSMF